MLAYDNFIFVPGSEDCSGLFCQVKYPDLQIQETLLEDHIRDVINRLVRTGSVKKGKSPGRPSVSEEIVDDLRGLEQNPQRSLTRLSQQPGVPIAT